MSSKISLCHYSTGHLGVNNRILYGLIGIAFVGGLFSAVYAGPMMPKITLDGDVDVTNNLDVGGKLTGVETLHGLSCGLGQIPRWNNIEWQCYGIGSGTPQIKYVTLNDDLIGNLNGWNPDGVRTSYLIIDADVSENSLIVASIEISGVSTLMLPTPSTSCTGIGVGMNTILLLNCSPTQVPTGSTLRYTVINPSF